MTHKIFFAPKENLYFNVCITHTYEIMTEFYHSLGDLLSGLREVATLLENDKIPPISEKEIEVRIREVEKILQCPSFHVLDFEARPYRRDNWINLRRAYRKTYRTPLQSKKYF